MGGGGGKGGSQSTKVKIPAWLEDAAKQNIARADVLSTIGYTPYYGPDVAAMTPNQIAAMQGTNQAALSFGLPGADPMAGMPAAQNFNGMQAYSSGLGFDQALADLAARRPGQYEALTAPFIDPVTGAAPASPFGPLVGTVPNRGAPSGQPTQGQQGGYSSSGGRDAAPMRPGGSVGGYTGIGDMINGGGPGASGAQFQGGPLSGVLNGIGVRPAGSGGSSGMGGGK